MSIESAVKTNKASPALPELKKRIRLGIKIGCFQ